VSEGDRSQLVLLKVDVDVVNGVGRLANLAPEMMGEAKRGAACFKGKVYI
jgi:hypothetical protein